MLKQLAILVIFWWATRCSSVAAHDGGGRRGGRAGKKGKERWERQRERERREEETDWSNRELEGHDRLPHKM